MSISRKFLGRGWSFPPKFDKNEKTVVMYEEEEDIHSSIFVILSTRLGERIMRPEFGTNLEELIFNNLTGILKTKVAESIKTSIILHEPRVKVIDVDISESNSNEGFFIVKLDYIIRATNSRFNEVYFELDKGVLKVSN